MNHIKKLTFFACLGMSINAFAISIFSISPTITSTTIRSDSRTLIPYTVTNNTKKTLVNITINPKFDTSANLSITNSTCNVLAPYGSCNFTLVIPGANQPSQFIVSPEVCAFNQTVCSQPVANQRLTVRVGAINHPVRAFVGLSNNTVLPITLVTGNAGNPGNAIVGFLLSEPAGIALNIDGTIAYVTNSGTNQVFAINTSTNQITQVFNVGNVPAALTVSPDGSKIYVVNYNNGQSSGTVSVINALNGNLIATIAIGNGPWGIAITPDGSKLYITNSFDGTVSVVNTATNTLINSIAIGTGTSPLGVAVTPDGTKVYVVNTMTNNVSVINTLNNQVIATIAVGNIPKGVAINPDGTEAFVGNWQEGTLTRINISTNQVIGSAISIGAGPVGLSVDPTGSQIYVTLDQTDAVAVISTSDLSVKYVFTTTPQVTMGNFTG